MSCILICDIAEDTLNVRIPKNLNLEVSKSVEKGETCPPYLCFLIEAEIKILRNLENINSPPILEQEQDKLKSVINILNKVRYLMKKSSLHNW